MDFCWARECREPVSVYSFGVAHPEESYISMPEARALQLRLVDIVDGYAAGHEPFKVCLFK